MSKKRSRHPSKLRRSKRPSKLRRSKHPSKLGRSKRPQRLRAKLSKRESSNSASPSLGCRVKKPSIRKYVQPELDLLIGLSHNDEKISLIENLSESGSAIYALLEGIGDPVELLDHLNNLANNKKISWKMWMILYNVAIFPLIPAIRLSKLSRMAARFIRPKAGLKEFIDHHNGRVGIVSAGFTKTIADVFTTAEIDLPAFIIANEIDPSRVRCSVDNGSLMWSGEKMRKIIDQIVIQYAKGCRKFCFIGDSIKDMAYGIEEALLKLGLNDITIERYKTPKIVNEENKYFDGPGTELPRPDSLDGLPALANPELYQDFFFICDFDWALSSALHEECHSAILHAFSVMINKEELAFEKEFMLLNVLHCLNLQEYSRINYLPE